jgi:hypothetical protein
VSADHRGYDQTADTPEWMRQWAADHAHLFQVLEPGSEPAGLPFAPPPASAPAPTPEEADR